MTGTAALRLVTSPPQHQPSEVLGDLVVFPRLGSTPSLAADADDFDTHVQRYGPRPSASGAHGQALVTRLHDIGLTGRGGGHFPAARKWEAVLAAGGGGTVVANGAEGEPASAKDAALLHSRTHLVLDGLVCAAEAVGADECVVWLHEGAHSTRVAVQRALQERRARRLPEPPIRIEVGPDRYLSGEATAVLRTLAGGPTLPQLARDPAAPWGRGNRPILLHNVETLARTAIAARTSAASYVPTSLITVVNHDRRVVCEVSAETTVAEVVASWWRPRSGTRTAVPQAVLLGGYGGSWLPWSRAASLPLDPTALREVGLSLGAGVIAPLPADACGVAEAAALVGYLADSSARQCGPCLFGLAAVADLTSALAEGSMSRSQARSLERFLQEIAGRGACRHPDGAIRMLSTALRTFADDVHSHRSGRRCLITGTRAPKSGLLPLPESA